jgi:hypothetical protein
MKIIKNITHIPEFSLLGYDAGQTNESQPTGCSLPAGFLLGLFFDPKDGGGMILQNVG